MSSKVPERPGEIARHGAQADAPGRRGLSHADAAVASGLVEARARAQQMFNGAHGDEVLQDLARGGIDIEGHFGMRHAVLDHLGRDPEIAQARDWRRIRCRPGRWGGPATSLAP